MRAARISAANVATALIIALAAAGCAPDDTPPPRPKGLLRGFQRQIRKRVDAAGVVMGGLRLLEKRKRTDERPFFLYRHFLNTHDPIDPPAPYRDRYPAIDGKARAREHALWPRPEDVRDPDARRRVRSHRLALYDGALRFIDDQLRDFSDRLREMDLLNETIFVIASDHGEAFWDHARFETRVHLDPRGAAGTGHGQSLFGEVIDVPLVLSGPGVPRGVVEEPVRNLDIAPTILALAGVAPGSSQTRGVDLIRARRDGSLGDFAALSEDIAYGVEARSIELRGMKLIRYSRTRTGQTEFLFDRSQDARETRNLTKQRPEVAAELGRRLDATFEGIAPGEWLPVTLPDSLQDELRAIGYGE